MPSKKKNLSDVTAGITAGLKDVRIGIVTSEWNNEITGALLQGCMTTLMKAGVKNSNIISVSVPGSFELPGAAGLLADKIKPDAVICLGCIIKGETRHDEYIALAVANGIMDLNVHKGIPFIFGVLTTNNYKQAEARAGGRHGNKGVEAAATALKMITLIKLFRTKRR